MSYTSWSVVFGEQPSAAKWNQLGSNDASFNNGTGIANISLSTTAIYHPYKFSAYRTAALTSSNTPTKVNLDTELFDTNNNFDSTTNYRYTVPVSGFYWFTGGCNNTVAGGPIATYLYKNGSLLREGTSAGTSTGGGISVVTGIFQLTAADYIELYFVGGSGSTVGIGSPYTYLDGFLVSIT